MAIIKIARFWPGAQRARGVATAGAIAPDGLDAFGSEVPTEPRGAAKRFALVAPAAIGLPNGRGWTVATWALVIATSAGAGGAGVWGYQRYRNTRAAASIAPIAVTPRPDPVPAPAVVTGSLRIETEPSKLPVVVDGVQRGTSPVTIPALSPGEHQVAVAGQGSTVRRTVSIRANETVSLIVSASPLQSAGPSGGFLSVASPLVLQLLEDGKVVGSTDMERVMLPAGVHNLELVNESVGYRARRKVTIPAGGTTRLPVELPQGTLNINAQPWAEVWLDGRKIGETPLARIATTIGTHEIVFRHPDLGERRTTVTVGMREPARVGIDLRKE